MDGVFSGPMAHLVEAAIGIKALISLVKYLLPTVGEPHPFTPLALRVIAVVLGEFSALALGIGVLSLEPTAAPAMVIGNKILGGLAVAAMSLGTHEVTKIGNG